MAFRFEATCEQQVVEPDQPPATKIMAPVILAIMGEVSHSPSVRNRLILIRSGLGVPDIVISRNGTPGHRDTLDLRAGECMVLLGVRVIEHDSATEHDEIRRGSADRSETDLPVAGVVGANTA